MSSLPDSLLSYSSEAQPVLGAHPEGVALESFQDALDSICKCETFQPPSPLLVPLFPATLGISSVLLNSSWLLIINCVTSVTVLSFDRRNQNGNHLVGLQKLNVVDSVWHVAYKC